MKKLIATIAILALSYGAFAQQINCGVRAGGNYTTLSGVDNTTFKLGYNFGAFAEYMVVSNIGVQAEINYSAQGANFAYTGSLGGINATWKGSYNFSYLNIPVLAKMHFGNLGVYVGPQFGFAVVASKTSEGTSNLGVNIAKKTTKYDKDDYNAFDLSLSLGACYNFYGNLGVDVRYNLGLTNVFTDNAAGSSAKPYGKNGAIQLGLIYTF